MQYVSRAHKLAEGAAAAPGVIASVYAAIAYDRQYDSEGVLVRCFAAISEYQAQVFSGDTYSPKLSILLMCLVLCLPPVLVVRYFMTRRLVPA